MKYAVSVGGMGMGVGGETGIGEGRKLGRGWEKWVVGWLLTGTLEYAYFIWRLAAWVCLTAQFKYALGENK